MKKVVLIVILIFLIGILSAQWSEDPGANLRLTNSGYEEVIPKIDYSPNGDVWVSWFSSEAGNYNVRLQHYNFNGEAQFAPEGLLVSNNTQMSWLTDWDMKVDFQNNAVLSFLDIRNGNQDIYVYKISPDGSFVWGENGIALSNDALEDYTPTLAITDQNSVIVAWMAGTDIKLQKILADGTVVLPQAMLFNETGYSHTWPQILVQENDSFILKYAKDSGPFYAVLRKVYAQKFDSQLNAVWTNPTTITEMGGISSWTQIFSTDSDGNGGFIICWYEDRDANQMRNVYIQHVLADGSVAFTQNGIEPTTVTSHQHFYPVCAYDPQSNVSYIFWSETDADQNLRGLSAQAFNAEGVKLWGDNGISIISLGNQSPMPSKADVVNNQLIALYSGALNGSVSDAEYKAFKLNTDGEFVWDGDFVALNNASGNIIHEEATSFLNNQLVAAWEDTRSTPTSIYVQNIHIDGTLGNQQVSTPTGISGHVTLNGGAGLVTNVTIALGDSLITPLSDGSYYQEIPAGIYSVTASLEGYGTVTIENVQIDSAQVRVLDIVLQAVTGNIDNTPNMTKFCLNNYPNPFNPETTISFNLLQNERVKLEIYNVKGQLIKTLINDKRNAGNHRINWDGKNNSGKMVTSGIYYSRLKTSQTTLVKKMLLIK